MKKRLMPAVDAAGRLRADWAGCADAAKRLA
jgi:hypothetical protein